MNNEESKTKSAESNEEGAPRNEEEKKPEKSVKEQLDEAYDNGLREGLKFGSLLERRHVIDMLRNQVTAGATEYGTCVQMANIIEGIAETRFTFEHTPFGDTNYRSAWPAYTAKNGRITSGGKW